VVAEGEKAPCTFEDGMGIAGLGLDIDPAVPVERVHCGRQDQRRCIDTREAAVTIRRPLHWSAYAIAIAEMDVVSHANLVAVVNDGGPWHRQQQTVHQLDTSSVAFE